MMPSSSNWARREIQTRSGRGDFRWQLFRGVHEAGEVRDVIAAIAAFGQMRACLLGKRLQSFLLQNKFYVFALHGTSLRG